MASVIVNENNEVLIDNNKALTCEPTKSWFYVTEYDSNGYPIKAKTIGCSGSMPYAYMYGSYGTYYNIISRFLQEFVINDGVTNIVDNTFTNCINLKSITIPDSVTSIGDSVFGYNKFKEINISNVTSLGEYAFNQCYLLTNLKLPKVISIGRYAFNYCEKCSLFDFRGATQVPTLKHTNAFNNTTSSKKIVVPDALYDEWITATNWSSTTNDIVSSIIKASEYEASL